MEGSLFAFNHCNKGKHHRKTSSQQKFMTQVFLQRKIPPVLTCVRCKSTYGESVLMHLFFPQGKPAVVLHHGGESAAGLQGVRGGDEASVLNLPGLC